MLLRLSLLFLLAASAPAQQPFVTDDADVSPKGKFLLTILNAAGTTPRRVTGLGDMNLSLKYNFYREREKSRLPAMTIAANFDILFSGNETTGVVGIKSRGTVFIAG